MKRLGQLWEAYINSGSEHFSTASDLKRNRVLNLLLSLNFLALSYLVVVELSFFAILLSRDKDRYLGYFIPFSIINIVYPIVIFAIIWLKNHYGTFKVTYFSTLTYTIYTVILCRFLGERLSIHLVLLGVLPIVFTMYDFGRWKEIFIHSFIMLGGIAAALTTYKFYSPLYPLPPDLAEIGGYLCWVGTAMLIFTYSVYNWRQVNLTENLLAQEKDHSEGLLKETIPKLEIAEAKYRHLVDDSSDLIFQMDEEGRILSMNKTAKALLGFSPEEMLGRTLYDFIPDGFEGDPELNRNIVREQVREFLEGQTLANFRTTLRKKHMYEPVDVQVSLQKNLIHWKVEIVGKISRLNEDVSQRFLEKEKGSYVITNNVTHAEVLSQRLSERVMRYFPATVVNTIRICFREILINAIEHGNLGISFDEKSAAIENSDYMEFLLARQKDPRYADKRVTVDYLINGKVLMFRITDDGRGFDHRSFLERAKNDPYLAMLEHGRGIIMTRNVFDSVVYNEEGNQVILTKRIPR